MEARKELKMFLTTGSNNPVQLVKVERELNFDVILRMEGVARFGILKKEQEAEVLMHIAKITEQFMKINFPDVSAKNVAIQFATDILESRADWTLYDVVYFFKFIRQRQDLPETKIFGNAFKMTPIVLMQLVAVYEEHKSYAMEQWRHNRDIEQKKLLAESSQSETSEHVKNSIHELANTLKNDQRERFYKDGDKTNNWHRENEYCLAWLKKQRVPKQVKHEWYNLFILRK